MRQAFRSEAQMQAAMSARVAPWWVRNQSTVRTTDSVGEAAHFLAGALLRSGFRLFRNGGLPLLERHVGPLREELIVQGVEGRRGAPAMVTARVHLSHEGLKGVRERYWQPSTRAPEGLASGNVGELELPPSWVMYTLEEGALAGLVGWIESVALPWLDLFEHPDELRRTLMELDVPLLGRTAALEWTLAEFGERAARDYLYRLDNEGLRFRRGDRIDSITTVYRLR